MRQEWERGKRDYQAVLDNWSNEIDPDVQKEKGIVGTQGLNNELPGEILLTFDPKVAFGFGHAGIVYNKTYAVEAMGGTKKKKGDGVKYFYTGPWKDPNYKGSKPYKKVRALNVQNNGKRVAKKFYGWAANNAKQHVGKPYNYNYARKYAMDKFYCSQLVWRVWKDAGYEVGSNTAFAVFPHHILNDKHTKVYYSRG